MAQSGLKQGYASSCSFLLGYSMSQPQVLLLLVSALFLCCCFAMNVANFRRSRKTSKVEAKELPQDDITIYKESRLGTCSESKRFVSLDCNRNQDVVQNCPCHIKIVCMALSLMLCAALIWFGYLPLNCLSGIATRQVSTSTSNATGVLEVFQVYQPVSTSGGADSACKDEILLMDHVFAYSYGQPFVGQWICSRVGGSDVDSSNKDITLHPDVTSTRFESTSL